MDANRLAVAFARVFRGSGIDVSVGSTIGFARALDCVGLATATGVYWAGRATLVRRPDDIEPYDRAFDAFWANGGPGDAGADLADPEMPHLAAFDVELPSPGDESDDQRVRPSVTVRWSPVETLRDRDFASYTTAEFEQARRLMADLRLTGARRPFAAPQAGLSVEGLTRPAPHDPPITARRG